MEAEIEILIEMRDTFRQRQRYCEETAAKVSPDDPVIGNIHARYMANAADHAKTANALDLAIKALAKDPSIW